jgi:hypothetical protein
MSWHMQGKSKPRLGRAVACRLCVLSITVLLVYPQYACHCGDGRVVPFCVPGKCGRCCDSGISNRHTCCGERASRSAIKRQQKRGLGGEATSPLALSLPCCKLVLTSKPLGILGVSAEPPLLMTIDLLSVVDVPIDTAVIASIRWRGMSLDSIHPPDDIVIRFLHLTI